MTGWRPLGEKTAGTSEVSAEVMNKSRMLFLSWVGKLTC